MDKVLITGGAGFIGGFLAEHLAARGASVHLADNLARGRRDAFLERLLAGGSVQLRQTDLLGEVAPAAFDDDYTHIVHLAAIVGVQNVFERPYATLRDNVRLLEATIKIARRQRRLARFVFASTSEIYAGALEHLAMPVPTPEDTPLALPSLAQPRSSYMLSKLYGEAMVRHAGLAFTILRPHNVYGPRMGLAHVVPQLMEKAHRAQPGQRLEVFSVQHTRTFCYIDDAVAMLVAAASAPACAGQALNLGSQAPEIRIGELAARVLATVGSTAEIVAMPATAGSPARRCPDMSRMTQLTGVQAGVELDEGLRRTWAWYRREVFDA